MNAASTDGPEDAGVAGAPFELVPLQGGRLGIRSRRYNEVCHPGVGPAAEAEALYVRGLDLARRLTALPVRGEFVIWDIGLGGAANAMAVLAVARATRARLRLVSFDHSLEPLAFAHAHREALGYFHDLAALAAHLLDHGAATAEGTGWRLDWRFVGGDFTRLARDLATSRGDLPAPHAILFDPHSPRSNPEMWTLPLFQDLRACADSDRPCSLATYSRSTAVRVALLRAGWWVGVGGATGLKEETTLAATEATLVEQPLRSEWLARARRSGAAEPWTESVHRATPLQESTWQALCRHPQFAGCAAGR